MKFVRFVTELARRRVFRLVGFYVVGAWLILQVASVTFDPIGLPDGSMRFLIYIIVVGFFPALVFSWRYDITTHGIVRATETGDATDAPLRRSDWLLISGSTIAAVLVATLLFVYPSAPKETDNLIGNADSYEIVYAFVPDSATESSLPRQFVSGVVVFLAERITPGPEKLVLASTSSAALVENADLCDAFDTDSGCSVVRLGIGFSDNSYSYTLEVDGRTKSRGSNDDLRKVLSDICSEFRTLVDKNSTVHSLDCTAFPGAAENNSLQNLFSGIGLLQRSEQGDLPAASRAFSDAANHGESVEAHAFAAVAQLSLVDVPGYPWASVKDKAKLHLDRAIALDNQHGATNMAAGLWYERAGEFQAASTHYELALEKIPSSPRILRSLLVIHDSLRHEDDALRVADRLRRINPFDVERGIEIARLGMRRGDFMLANQTLGALQASGAATFDVLKLVGDAHYLDGDCDSAVKAYEQIESERDDIPRVRLANSGFEEGIDSWTARDSSYVVETDDRIVRSGEASLRIGKIDGTDRFFSRVSQGFRPCKLRGRWVRISAGVRTEGVSNEVGISAWASSYPRRAEAKTGRTVFESDFGPGEEIGDSDWASYEQVVEVPTDAYWMRVAVWIRGPGLAWFDDLEIENLDGPPPSESTD